MNDDDEIRRALLQVRAAYRNWVRPDGINTDELIQCIEQAVHSEEVYAALGEENPVTHA